MSKEETHSYLQDYEIHWPVTKRLRKDPKFIAFNQWGLKHGAIHPYVDVFKIIG